MLKINIFFAIIFFAFPFSLMAEELSSSVDNQQVAYGEAVEFHLAYDGSDGNSITPDLSVLQKDFDIRSTSSSVNSRIINGVISQKREWILMLLPKNKGKITIPAVKAGKYSSQPIDIEVVSGQEAKQNLSAVSGKTDNQAKTAFFNAVWKVDQSNVYIEQGIPVVLTVKDNRNLQLSREPYFENTDDWEIKIAEKPRNIQKDGENITEFYYILTPRKSGNIELPQAIIDGYYMVYDGSVQNSFGNSIFQLLDMGVSDIMGVQKPVMFRSDRKTINVKSIPQEYVGKQWLPAEVLIASAEWEDKKPEFKVGETVTRNITIIASGVSEDKLPNIEFADIPYWKQYPDKPQYSSAVHDNNFISQETVRVVYIPQKSGKLSLPEIKIPWFNVKTQKTEIAVIAEETIDVKPNIAYENISPSEEKNNGVQVPDVQEPSTEVKENKKSDNNFTMFVAVLIAFVSGIGVSFLLWGQKDNHKKVTEQDSLKKLKQNLRARDYREIRNSLLQWGKKTFPQNNINNLKDLTDIVKDDAFTRQCEIINLHLYSDTSEILDDKIIIGTLKDIGHRKAKRAYNPLPDLYK